MKFSKEARVGFLVTAALAALIWGLNYLKGKDFFTTDNKFICQCYSHDDYHKAYGAIVSPCALFDQVNKFITTWHFVASVNK